MCATHAESLIRRDANKAALRPVVVHARLSHSCASVAQKKSIRGTIPDVRNVFLERHNSEVWCRSGVSLCCTEGRTL